MTRYGMVIDLDRCIGCHGCTAACRQENATPPGVRWTRVTQVDEGRYPKVRRSFIPHGCMHCANPPCVEVCPSGASFKRADGLVLVDQPRCIGCKACMVACPYEARSYLDRPRSYFREPTPFERARPANEHQKGTVEKCTFCAGRLEQGLLPACVDNCPAGARYFGDLENPESEVYRLARDPRALQPGAEWGTNPSVYYLMPYVRQEDQEDLSTPSPRGVGISPSPNRRGSG